MDYEIDTGTTVVSSPEIVADGRGSQETELGTPEACLIPSQECNQLVDDKPKEGVMNEKYFIRSARVEREIVLDVTITTLDTHDSCTVKALLDSGATGLFINWEFMHKSRLKTRILPYLIKVYNIDGTLNQGGSITEKITLMMSHRGHKERAVFEVCDLGKATLTVGHPWLQKHNPEVNWKTGEVKLTHCPAECNVFIRAARKDCKWKKIADRWKYRVMIEEEDDEEWDAHIHGGVIEEEDMILEKIIEEHFIRKMEMDNAMPDLRKIPQDDDEDDEIVVFHIKNGKKAHYIASTTRPASWGNKDLNLQMKDEKKTPEEMVPKQFHKFMKVFSKKASERMPMRKPWDHAIEMKPSFEPKKVKNIPLSPQEQKEVEEFLNN
jgi:hypothetical protein